MSFLSTKQFLSAVLGAAVLASVAAAPAAAHAATRSTAEGLLVFAVDTVGQNIQYASVGNSRLPFGGEVYDDLGDALDNATELDLTAFDSAGRIKLKGFNTCLGVAPATPNRSARAVAEVCNADDPEQEWRIDGASGDLLRNVGSGLWVDGIASALGWVLTDTIGPSRLRVLPDYLDGRPVLVPRFDVAYDHDTDVIQLSVRKGAPRSVVVLQDNGGQFYAAGTTDANGALDAELPREFGDQEFVHVTIGTGLSHVVELRVPAIDHARIGFEPDGVAYLYGEGAPGMPVRIGTGPLKADVVVTDVVSDSSLVRTAIPGAQPGDTFVVYLGVSGVRTTVTVPTPTESLIAVDGPDTVLDREHPTRVPVGVRAGVDITRITSSVQLHAPAGTVFTPGTTALDGEHKPTGGAWGGIDPRYQISDVDISADGRTLTATYDLGLAERLEAGDELRWWPSLDVVDPSTAPARV